MAAGDLTLTNHGVVSVSGGDLKERVELINISTTSGAVHLIPTANGTQILIIEIEQATS